MLALAPWGAGVTLDSNDARLGRSQPAPASKARSTAEPLKRSPAMFISFSSYQALTHRPSAGRDDLARYKISDRDSTSSFSYTFVVDIFRCQHAEDPLAISATPCVHSFLGRLKNVCAISCGTESAQDHSTHKHAVLRLG